MPVKTIDLPDKSPEMAVDAFLKALRKGDDLLSGVAVDNQSP